MPSARRPERWRWRTGLAVAVCAFGACFAPLQAEPAGLADRALSLRSLGAVGDGLHDDTAALRAALGGQQGPATIDGEGLSYRVRGGLLVERDLRLSRLRLLQDPELRDGEGPPQIRTLQVRGRPERPLRIEFRQLRIDRGSLRNQGSPEGAAGLWLEHVHDSQLEHIEISGNGRGAGLAIHRSQRLLISDLHVHSMVWAPCAAQAEGLPWAAISAAWNAYRVLPMHDCREPATARQRIREALVGVLISRSQQIQLLEPVIEGLHAAFQDGRTAAWQTDGITVESDALNADGSPQPSRVLIRNARVRDVWEGIDLNGQPLTDVRIDNAQVDDTHAFGIKVVNGAGRVRINRALVQRSGLAAFVIGGSAWQRSPYAAVHDVEISDSLALDTGSGLVWHQQATIAGFRLMSGSAHDPQQVRILRSRAIDRQPNPTMSFGLHVECRAADQNFELGVHGARQAERHLESRPCR